MHIAWDRGLLEKIIEQFGHMWTREGEEGFIVLRMTTHAGQGICGLVGLLWLPPILPRKWGHLVPAGQNLEVGQSGLLEILSQAID